MVFVLSRFLLGEPLTLERFIGIAMGFTGVLILALSKASATFSLLGFGFVILNALGFALFTVFVKKWSKAAESVATSLEEAGEHLLTFYDFPKSQWKSLRTTNAIERLNEEFKRRTKTQGSFRNESSALLLLYGLLAIGHVRLRKIDGYRDLAEVTARAQAIAA